MRGKEKQRGEAAQPESQRGSTKSQMNWLRAGVLGANDGIISMAGLVLGVAGATSSQGVVLAAGIAGIIAGAISMAAGEYVSVSSARDTELVLLKKERQELQEHPAAELEELVGLYQERGLSRKTAEVVANELTKKDAFAAHIDIELGLDPNDLTNPWHAAIASAVSFFLGALIPLVAILLPPVGYRVPVAFLAVLLALVVTGTVSGKLTGAHIPAVVFRVVLGGVLAMAVTYGIGRLFNTAGL